MDYLQYNGSWFPYIREPCSFKPCYKWITFNTMKDLEKKLLEICGFKPCYKWITFNTIICSILSNSSFVKF